MRKCNIIEALNQWVGEWGEFKKTLRPLRKSWDSVGFILLVADGLLWYMSVQVFVMKKSDEESLVVLLQIIESFMYASTYWVV